MTELILSDITRMAGGHCIIGLQKAGQRYQSIRPLPPSGNAWPSDFPHHRGAVLMFELSRIQAVRPHVEDHKSTGVLGSTREVSETELLNCLHQAEVANSVVDLFGGPIRPGARHGAHLHAPKGMRSICGAQASHIRLKCEASDVRASIAFAWGESLADLPLVDRSWCTFLKAIQHRMTGAHRQRRLNLYLEKKLSDYTQFFVRLGLTRPYPPKFGRCQVMLDTILPMPRKSWVDEYLRDLRLDA